MSDSLFAPTCEIIRCCEALLSEADGRLHEKQRQWVESINAMAGEQTATEDSGGLLSAFNRYMTLTKSEENDQNARRDLLFFVPTPIAVIRTKVLLLLNNNKFGRLNEKQRAYVEQVQHCTDQIQDEVNRIGADRAK